MLTCELGGGLRGVASMASPLGTRRMNWILTHKLRGWAQELRAADPAARAAMKATFLQEYLQALVVSLGPPPKTFDWNFTDKDGKF